MLPIERLQELIRGKKVAFIGAGVSHKRCIEQFVELGAQVTLCDQKKSVEEFGDYADTLRRLNVALSLGEHYTDGFAGQDIIMRTPGYEYITSLRCRLPCRRAPRSPARWNCSLNTAPVRLWP